MKARRAARANAAKKKAAAKRRNRKINKVVARVLTDMNDDKATMYRQYVDPAATVKDGNGVVKGLDGIVGNISNGDFVSPKDPLISNYLRRNEANFFQIDAYHGMIAPSWQDGNNFRTQKHDNQINPDTGVGAFGSVMDNPLQHETPLANNRIDIRAFKEIEIPFLPCIPALVRPEVHYTSDAGDRMVRHELEQFCRTNNKIKITNNYMRFRFFATPNGQIEQTGQPTRMRMTGDFTNIEPTFSAVSNGTFGHPSYPENAHIEYRITAKRFAKVRIILYERDQEEEHSVKLRHFMKYGHHNLNLNGIDADSTLMPGGNLFTTEEYRLGKRFHSPLKSKMDCLYGPDRSTEERLMGGKLIMDKVINLKMGEETVFTCNPLSGKVLEYDDVKPHTQRNDDGDDEKVVINEDETKSDTQMEVDTQDATVTTTLQEHDERQGLPIHVNSDFPLYLLNNDSDDDLNRQKSEYKPKHKQYGMFMLLYCQRAGIEYDIFQKFEYDK